MCLEQFKSVEYNLYIITSKQMQQLSSPEFSRHLCFPSICFPMQILHTSQWKDVSLFKLKQQFD